MTARRAVLIAAALTVLALTAIGVWGFATITTAPDGAGIGEVGDV